MLLQEGLNVRQWRACLHSEHKFCRLIVDHAGDAVNAQSMRGLHRPAPVALGAAADYFQRSSLGGGPFDDRLQLVSCCWVETLSHGFVLFSCLRITL
ncbi:hypothetical protein PsW74_04927 [Pseudovibrio sp. W74]|nr:hypothetical protein PsW74_04927 [Pseudovibrio sp. W74]